MIEDGVRNDLVKDLLRAVDNSLFETLAELSIDLIRVQFHVVGIDLEIALVDVDVNIGQVEANALELAGVIEMLERDNLWLELLLNVIQLEADH